MKQFSIFLLSLLIFFAISCKTENESKKNTPKAQEIDSLQVDESSEILDFSQDIEEMFFYTA